MSKVYVFDHPLIQHKTALIRKTETGTKDFRELVVEISRLMGFEATRHLPLKEVEIETPICKTKVNMLDGEDVAIVPILRAGLGMVDGFLDLVPNAKVGFVGLYRDPDTHQPVEYTASCLTISVKEKFSYLIQCSLQAEAQRLQSISSRKEAARRLLSCA